MIYFRLFLNIYNKIQSINFIRAGKHTQYILQQKTKIKLLPKITSEIHLSLYYNNINIKIFNK